MNPNPYPRGRWTEVVAGAATRKTARNRLTPEPTTGRVGAPLRELFWGSPEAGLADDTRRRLDTVLAAACNEPLPEICQPELVAS